MYVIRTEVPNDATVTTQTFGRVVKIITSGMEICKNSGCQLPTFIITSDKWEHIENMKAYVDEASGLLVYVPTPKENNHA